MSKLIRQAVIAAWVTTALAACVRAGISLDQPPNRAGGSASDTEFFSPGSGLPTWQLIAENLMLAEPAVVRRVVFWGFYGSNFDMFPEPAPQSETMRIRMYSARMADGLPDDNNILFEESFLNPTREATGWTIALGPLPPEYRFEVDLASPLHLAANTLYWLEIAQLGNVESHFRWENAVGAKANLPGFAFVNPATGDWRSAPGSFAFQFSAIPEPCSAVLFLFGLLMLRRRRVGGGGFPLNRPESNR